MQQQTLQIFQSSLFHHQLSVEKKRAFEALVTSIFYNPYFKYNLDYLKFSAALIAFRMINLCGYLQIQKIVRVDVSFIRMHTHNKRLLFAEFLQSMSSALESLAHFIHSIDSSCEVSSINSMQIAIQYLDGLLEIAPKKMTENIDNLIYILEFFVSQPDSWMIDNTDFLDSIIEIVAKYPKLVNCQTLRGTKLFKIALDILSQISSQTSEQWLNPPDGFTLQLQDDVDSQAVENIMGSVGTLAEKIGIEVTLTHLQPLFLEHIQKDDWRYPYAALMISSQITHDEVSLEPLGLIVQWAISMTEHYHPKVKYAALHLIGKFGQDLSPDFQENYHSSLVPAFLKLLQDPVPRVVAQTFTCMSNFFQDCRQLWRIESVISQFLAPIIHYIKLGSTWVKEAALSTLASFAMIQEAFGANLPDIFGLCAELIGSYLGNEEHKEVLNQTIQIISILLSCQKKQNVQHYLSPFVALIFDNQSSISITYIFQAWQRICYSYQQFTDITQIYGILLQNAKALFNQQDSDSCVSSLKCLNRTLNSFKSKASLYAAQTATFAHLVFQNSNLQKLKEEGFMLEIATITTTKPTQQQNLGEWFHQAYKSYEKFLNMIYERLQVSNSFSEQIPYIIEGVGQLVQSFKELVDGNGLLSLVKAQLQIFKLICVAYEEASNEQSQNQDENQVEAFQSDSQYSFYDIDACKYLEDALERIPSILQQLLSASLEPKVKMEIYKLYRQKIQESILKKPPFVQFSLNLMIDIIQVFGYDQINTEYPEIIQCLRLYMQNPAPNIRNNAVYGFNKVFSKVPIDYFRGDQIQNLLEMLSKSFNTSFSFDPNDSSQVSWVKACKDNVISALGTLLKRYGDIYSTILNQQIFKFWLSNLPLNQDIQEGNQQQQILIYILETCPPLLIHQPKDLLTICEIYVKFVNRRGEKEYSEIVEKTKKSLQSMSQWSLFKDSADYLWNSLNESHKKTLTRMMAN